MHRFIFSSLILVIMSLSAQAQKTYQETVEADGTKIMVGVINKEVLQYETSFTWFAQNQQNYTPPPAAVEAFKKNGSKIHIICFGGTWCGDTKAILPKFYTLITAAGFMQSRLTVIGVDRSKKTYAALAESLGITNVPTFIILKNGKEVGRVVEYGKTGYWDKELGEIVAGVE
jgi:thiol-disulfide isomerase/thioredoxin